MSESRRERLSREAYEYGYEFEKRWGNCAQATMWAVSKALGRELDRKALRAISAFHAGGGAFCDGVCGAYVAVAYLIGERYGRDIDLLGVDEDNARIRATMQKTNERVGRLGEWFRKEYGTMMCSEIHTKLYGRTFNLKNSEEMEEFENAGAHEWGCTSVVGKAAAFAVDLLLDEENRAGDSDGAR